MNETQKLYNVPVYKISLVRDGKLGCAQRQIRSSFDAITLVRQYLAGADREHFVVLLLDAKNKVIGINTVSTGSLSASVVHPREVFKPAIVSNANALVCAHNHPSGDPQPSNEDRAITRRLVAAGTLLGIAVLDHVILGDGTENAFSFADQGILNS